MTFPVYYEVAELDSAFTLQDIYDKLVENLSGYVDSFISGGQEYSPKFNGVSWMVWDGQKYIVPNPSVGLLKLDGDPTSDRIQTMKDQDGVIALLDDVYGIRDTVVLPDGAVGVDWDRSNSFKCIIKRITYLHMQHAREGMTVNILIVNNGTDNTINWDASIKWPKDTTPQMPVSASGASVSMLVTLRKVNGIIYGESQLQTHPVI
jgi:hypothetical protein